MKRLLCLALALIFLASPLPALAGALAVSERGKVFIVPVQGTVSPGLASFVSRALGTARSQGATAVVLEIGTLGGLVSAALDMRDAIMASPVPVHALVTGRAWSAGALIALACKKVAMTPGSSIGSAEPRPADAKTVSALRAEFEATAEARGRDTRVAAAMVDQSIVMPGLKEKGQLLNLTAMRAKELSIADAVVENRQAALSAFGLEGHEVIEVRQSVGEVVSGVVTDPAVSILLLVLGVGGLLIEAIRPGFGVPGVVGLLALATLLAGRSVARLTGAESALLFLAGLALLVIEAFLPGFGIIGISGVIMVLLGIIMAARSIASVWSLALSLAICLLLIIVLVRYALKKGVWSGLAMHTTLEKAPDAREHGIEVGQEGVAVTPLRPSGVAVFNGRRLSVVARGEYLEQGSRVVVVSIEGNHVTVRPAN